MKFFISRTSDDNTKPVEQALKENNNWIIHIETLEELIEFSKEFGELIISDNSIEIYDWYRE